MKNFILIYLSTLAGYIIGELIYSKFFVIGIILFILVFSLLILFSDKFNKEKYTYWLVTIQKPFKREGKITVTSTIKIKNNFFSKKDIDKYYNEVYCETGKWNILFYSELTKEEYDIYNLNENQNEQVGEEIQNRENS